MKITSIALFIVCDSVFTLCVYARVIRPSYTASVSTCKSEMLIALEFAQFIRYANSTMTKALPLCYAAMGAKCGFGADFFCLFFQMSPHDNLLTNFETAFIVVFVHCTVVH